MSYKTRMIWATLAGAWSYLIYIYLVNYIFDLIGEPNLNFSGAVIELGNLIILRYYIVFFGWCIVGLSFATQMAQKKTAARQIWNLLRLVAGVVFWSMFIAAGLNNFLISADFPQFSLNIVVDLTILFYAMMGGKIFMLILIILDFFISFIDEDDKKNGGK